VLWYLEGLIKTGGQFCHADCFELIIVLRLYTKHQCEPWHSGVELLNGYLPWQMQTSQWLKNKDWSAASLRNTSSNLWTDDVNDDVTTCKTFVCFIWCHDKRGLETVIMSEHLYLLSVILKNKLCRNIQIINLVYLSLVEV